MREIKEIIIHCSATPEGKNFHVEDIDKWHKERGWNGCGYHYVVALDGTVEVGRHEKEIGAHTQGHNQRSIGVCYIGGLAQDGKTAKDTRTEAQKRAMLNLISMLKAKYPNVDVYGHNEVTAKACPCFNARNEYKDA